ncbi:YheC/YheD family protein [Paenibacillus aceris]|uniref:Glutathione synthase/RimK-type ligase-like ATP-grasp enzyme n=1 Tax=Paenibacillus aceris TaxID=869555 RepID=A0ABS4HYD7_9BACL|nr:YheC/YheD family protein [Paenibacillus aceris]MBP1963682.1 glutathione synthase/RimK-type ligase-like ATP-grasp enzyme [Paenibacillus aceris]NHW36941.1 YheC/YheD family protein [Paenibacillus aceris]
MTRTKVGISIQGTSIYLDDRTVVLSEAIARKWKVPSNQSMILRFGSAKQEVKVVTAATSKSLRFNPVLATKIGIHQGAQLNLHYRQNAGTLSIGPLIGVMISRVYTSSPDRPFGAITAFCKEMTDACERYGAMVCFFPPGEMHANASSISAYAYSNGSWNKKTFPIPNVIYNRLTSRKYENLPNVQQFLKDAKARHGTEVFNEKYLNKTEVFEALRKDSSLHGYLPESYLFKNYQMLKSMASRHPVLFLKPITGSLGKGIIRIRREPGDAYTCDYTNLTGVRKQTYPSLTAVFQAISGKLKTQRYQLQQGLDLITMDGKTIDFRSLVQRGAKGEWAITSIVGRIAGTQHFVSNLARGGSLTNVAGALAKSSFSPATRVSVTARLRKASLDIAKGIETQIPSHFGELGIDLAVDRTGKVWLLEVNSKPSKDDNTPLNNEKKIRPSVKQLVHYAKYLAKI